MTQDDLDTLTDLDQELVYYIAGPMKGYTNFNHETFEGARDMLTLMGYKVKSPTDNEVSVNAPPVNHLKADIIMLLNCSGIILLPGWTNSAGANMEYQIAKGLGYPMGLFVASHGRVYSMDRRIV